MARLIPCRLVSLDSNRFKGEVMTRQEQQDLDKRYEDWREVYREDVVERVKHWGDKRKRGNSRPRVDSPALDGALAPGR